jgi:hypothetical protein
MTNREKIIVGLMLLTVAYGVYALFFEGKVKSSSTTTVTSVSVAKQLETLNEFITKVAEASQAGLSKEDKYIISRAESAWKQDPLTTVELTDRPEDEIKRQQVVDTSGPQLDVSYTGFMQMGEKKFAVIDGLEYTTGDELAQGGFVVSQISPNNVVIISTGRSKKRFVFPLEE